MTDFLTLCRAIASQLDGSIRPSGDNADDAPPQTDIVWIDLANEREGLRVVIRRGMGSESTRLRAVMSQTMASRDGADYREAPAFYTLETAAAMSRGADVIARQIESKIVQPAIPMLEAWQIKRAEQKAESARLVEAADRWRKRFPGARVEIGERDTEARLYMAGRGSGGGIVRGRINADGGLYLEYATRIPESVAFDLCAAVTGS